MRAGDRGGAGELQEAQLSSWRRSLIVGAALVSLYIPIDLHYSDGRHAAAWRAGWVLALLVAAALQHPRSARLATVATHLCGVLSGYVTTVVVICGGGSTGPRFGILHSLPLAALLLLPHQPSVAAITAASSLAGGAFIIAREGRDFWFAFEWAMLAFALGVLATLGASSFHRIWVSELEAQRARSEALARLAESERRRAQAERLALVGRLAAEVAHEINNPLAYVKSSLQNLRRGSADGEQAEILSDALHGIERIAQIVGELRGLVRSEAPDGASEPPEDERPPAT
jgi:signal transduction histidine kinase